MPTKLVVPPERRPSIANHKDAFFGDYISEFAGQTIISSWSV
jgi:hypothetical protein